MSDLQRSYGVAEVRRSGFRAGAELMSREVRRTSEEREISAPDPCRSPDTSLYSLPTQLKTRSTSPLSRTGTRRSNDRPSSTPANLRFIPTSTTPPPERPSSGQDSPLIEHQSFQHQVRYQDGDPTFFHQWTTRWASGTESLAFAIRLV